MKFKKSSLLSITLVLSFMLGTAPFADSQPVTDPHRPLERSNVTSETEGPFSYWGFPTPPGAESYEVNEVAEKDLSPEGLNDWHPTVAPQSEIIRGQMRSDKQDIPAGFDKALADEAELKEAALAMHPVQSRSAGRSCSVYWPAPHEVCGAIKHLYDKLGGPFSFLSLPKSNELTNPDGVGKRSEFLNGFIYWHPSTGAHAVGLPEFKVWARNGWEQGILGYPTTSAISLGNAWYRQYFEGGHVYVHNALPISQASIHGAIYEKWQSMGAENSELGFPISDELTTPDGIGRYNFFEHGAIYWTPQHGAHPVTEPVLTDWANSGYEKGPYGYPVESAKPEKDFVSQRFTGGVLEAAIKNPLMNLTSTPYIEFPNDAMAKEFFDRVEAGLEEIPQRLDTSLRQDRAAIKRYGPCDLELDHPHPRKSSNYGRVGFKARTSCTEEVLSVTHTSTLRYQFYLWWKKAPDISNVVDINPDYKQGRRVTPNARSRGHTHQYSTLDLEQNCVGNVPTKFVGVTEGKIVTNAGTYYTRTYSTLVTLDCEVP